MNTFLSEITRRDLDYVLQGVKFKRILPMGAPAALKIVRDLVESNARVYIDPDCDPDGYFSALIIKTMFDKLGHTNYVVGRHDVKRHVVRQSYVNYLLGQDFDAYIFVDSSSGNMQLINAINDAGKKLIIIDHHDIPYRAEDFPKDVVVINPILDSKIRPVVYDKLSAGAVCALVCDYILESFGVQGNTELYIYGYITLYSDACDLSNMYNIAYIKRFGQMELFDSELIRMFWTQYSHLDRNFVSYRLVPRLNAMFRMEEFDKLYKLFFDLESIEDPEALLEEVEDIYRKGKDFTLECVKKCSVTQYKNFTVAMLQDDVDRKARNFTGQIANVIASEVNQPVMCLVSTDNDNYGGSVRDPFSRDIKAAFGVLFYAEGHGSAFGVKIAKDSLSEVTKTLDNLTDVFSQSKNDVIIIGWDNRPKAEVAQEQRVMAEYNEFGGQALPKAIGLIQVKKSWKIYRKEKYTSIYGDGMKFTCFVPGVDVGDLLLVSPQTSGASIQLLVDNVSYHK